MREKEKKKEKRNCRGLRTGPRENGGANGGGQPSHRAAGKRANMNFSCQVATLLKTLLFRDTRATFLLHIPSVFAQHSKQTTPAADSLSFVLHISPISKKVVL